MGFIALDGKIQPPCKVLSRANVSEQEKRNFPSAPSLVASGAAFIKRLLCGAPRACLRGRSSLGEGMVGQHKQDSGPNCEKHSWCIGIWPLYQNIALYWPEHGKW